jgi:hypothetical protein
MTLHGIDLCAHILKYAGLPTIVTSYLLTMPAKPLNQPTIITQAGLFFEGHAWLFAGIALFGFLSIILTMHAATEYVMQRMDGDEVESEYHATEYVPKYAGAFLVFGISMLIGFMLCIIPGLYVMSAGTLLFPIIRNPEISIFSGFKSSLTMIRHHALKPIAFMLLISVITSIPSTALGVIADLPIPYLDAYLPRIIAMINALISVLTLSFIAVFGIILHKELLKGTEFHSPHAPIN